MDIKIHKSLIQSHQSRIKITGSKSESNRLLLLRALYPNINIDNISNSDDSTLMQEALCSISEVIDIHHAGTAMRFLTAYFSIQDGRETILTGSKRMKERPIAVLVEALQSLGADIAYLENEGYPPLKINGKQLTRNKVQLRADVSSQYISALLLIGSRLENGIELTLNGKVTSVPYIKMTLRLLDEIDVENTFIDNVITVNPKASKVESKTWVVESDWSSASYFYSIVAMSPVGTSIELSSYKKESLQGDSVLAEIYRVFDVETTFVNNSIILNKIAQTDSKSSISLDLSNAPDIAQTIAVTAFGLGLECNLSGLHTLKIKETDRLEALKTELTKLGAKITVTDYSLSLLSSDKINSNIEIETYNDHRMAMAFAPLALRVPIIIKEANVVSKSYPDFWTDLKHLGFQLNN
ncbi:MAG: 3-phosphoshikimate 1-carboxyvinyltransferase [Winogradskyella sp.]|uniref:3-phosphoshikimate 1-carboxyvinyltransferase n=1 Tax=Winogradskyella sp. TaxID=1883156 RepID=UPI000F40EB6E|nr:3-phosphoshikimate 1-carboxyvinyltransferase [Winogradskyella sp.]RNC84177.1 MAG: 3-phosphoshikimate 1-carboxyvinyltransferase [Winogradskyella sp.]